MEDKIVIAGICGSLRKESYNKKLMKVASELFPQNTEFFGIDIANLPLYNADFDEPDGIRPQTVVDFRNALAKADGILFVSPEYNYSISGVLKNAIDWASRGDDSPIKGKPASLMGASIGIFGTARGQLASYPVFQFCDIQLVKKPEIYISKVHTKFDSKGKLIDDFAINLIKENLQNLTNLIRKQK